MKIDIYLNGTTTGAVATVETSDAKVSRELCGKDQITFSAQTNSYINFPLTAAIRVQTSAGLWMYRLAELPTYEKKGDYSHFYNFVFRSPIFDLEKISFVNANGESEFFHCGTAREHLQIIFDNLDRAGSSVPDNFDLGVAPQDEYKNIQYSGLNCLGALNVICDEFDLEYEHYQAYINLVAKVGNTTTKAFQYGKGKSLSHISRNTVDVDKMVTRLYYRGSNRNLPLDYSHDRLRGSVDYIEDNSTGDYVEDTVNFDEIYPTRTGTIGAFEITDDEDFILTDATMFDLNAKDEFGSSLYFIEGTTGKVNFLTGDCAGYTLDIAKYDDDAKKIYLIPFEKEDGTKIPNATIKPASGDEYVLIDIRLPQSYVTDAVERLDARAQEYLLEKSVPRVSYTISSNPSYWAANNVSINVGDQISVIDTQMSLSISTRVISVEFPLSDPHNVTMKLSDVKLAVAGRQRAISQARTNNAVKVSRINTVEKLTRNIRSTRELQARVFSHKDNFFIPENNKPESLDPYMLALDSGEIQFSLKSVRFSATTSGLAWTSGTVIHHSFFGKTRDEISKAGELYDPTRTWTLVAGTAITPSDITDYFAYIKLPLINGQDTAEILLSEDHIYAKQDEDYIYYKLGELGALDSESGKRSLKLLWGESAPSDIVTESDLRKTFISLDDTPATYIELGESVAGRGLVVNPVTNSDIAFAKAFGITSAPQFYIRHCCPDFFISDEEVVNGDFETDLSGWTAGTGWAFANGAASHVPGNTATLKQQINIDTRSRQLSMWITVNAGSLSVQLGSLQSYTFNDSGLYNRFFTGGSSAAVYLTFTPSEDFDGSISSVSLIPESQSSGGDAPLLFLDASGRTVQESRWLNNSWYLGIGTGGLSTSQAINNVALAPEGLIILANGNNITALGNSVGNTVVNSSGHILIGYGADIPDDETDGYLCISNGVTDFIRGYADNIEIAGGLKINADSSTAWIQFPVTAATKFNSILLSGSTSETLGNLAWSPYSMPASAPIEESFFSIKEDGDNVYYSVDDFALSTELIDSFIELNDTPSTYPTTGRGNSLIAGPYGVLFSNYSGVDASGAWMLSTTPTYNNTTVSVNTNFNTNSDGWTFGANWSWASGKMWVTTGTTGRLQQSLSFVAGRCYRIVLIGQFSDGVLKIRVGETVLFERTTYTSEVDATYEVYYYPENSNSADFSLEANITGEAGSNVDNFYVEESYYSNQSGPRVVDANHNTKYWLPATSGQVGDVVAMEVNGQLVFKSVDDLILNSENWDLAYSWGDHSEQGYITGITKSMVESVLNGEITSHSHPAQTGSVPAPDGIGRILISNASLAMQWLGTGAFNQLLKCQGSGAIPQWTSIKTINGTSIIGTGDIAVGGSKWTTGNYGIYYSGHVGVGGIADAGFTFAVTGSAFAGELVCNTAQVTNAANGTFTTVNGKTVTVTYGIVTSIV